MRPKADRRHLRRGVVDTSVLVAGISAFRREPPNPQNTSARLLRGWVERRTFTWLVSVDILDEYRDVLRRLKVRRATVGRVINLLAEAAEAVALVHGSWVVRSGDGRVSLGAVAVPAA